MYDLRADSNIRWSVPDYSSAWEVSEWGPPSYFASTLEN